MVTVIFTRAKIENKYCKNDVCLLSKSMHRGSDMVIRQALAGGLYHIDIDMA